MNRPLSPFWALDWWSAWWDAWGATPFVAPLRDAGQARALEKLHATAFARPWAAHEFERLLCERSTEAHALWRGGSMLGFVLSRKAVDEAEILTIVLAPSARGGGHSTRLLRDHLTALAFGGVRTVHLEVDEGNAPALKLYQRAGFVRVGERKGYYPLPDGSRATALTMSATLS
ncbi:GNAT family N-acetyltransferase [Methylobacterium sp. Leaf118]|uniref:GNAT family N-acetyltransferase n=1 Tax=Methylobacterium sp. Leaf118 TaxID=2876562 RepID=UPI001E2D9C5A|nr:GNAT family N-acetyltransferase [Methylobacterium sp. Leaf118]